MGFFDEKAITGRFTNSDIAKQNLHGFSNIWSNFTSGDKLKGAFFFPVRSSDGELRLAVWIDYYETAETHCYLVIDGPFLSAANVELIAELLGLTEAFQGKLLASGAPAVAGVGQKVFYCKYAAPDTVDLHDALEAAHKFAETWLKTDWHSMTAEEFLQLFQST
ncbi:hypothetical protein [Paraburkholderia bryophila]|uniref:Uncharacterized protein n=1 Tax=Paraburkholderia bryophila TaxID=420952 RepID=A0A7Y9WSF9_9BURK|nr:hypothetical protein [Paraburkholderia bryophila]NYH26247.1 hypothetical protein [Paraburkholderia bryophila]